MRFTKPPDQYGSSAALKEFALGAPTLFTDEKAGTEASAGADERARYNLIILSTSNPFRDPLFFHRLSKSTAFYVALTFTVQIRISKLESFVVGRRSDGE